MPVTGKPRRPLALLLVTPAEKESVCLQTGGHSPRLSSEGRTLREPLDDDPQAGGVEEVVRGGGGALVGRLWAAVGPGHCAPEPPPPAAVLRRTARRGSGHDQPGALHRDDPQGDEPRALRLLSPRPPLGRPRVPRRYPRRLARRCPAVRDDRRGLAGADGAGPEGGLRREGYPLATRVFRGPRLRGGKPAGDRDLRTPRGR